MANRRINIREFTEDVRSNVSDADLMTRYKLSRNGLRKAFTKLLDSEILTPSDIRGRLPDFESPIDVQGIRVMARNYLTFPVPVYESDNLLARGEIDDISEKGMQISGIDAQPGESKSLLIRADEFHDIFPFVFEARCQWARREISDDRIVAGYEIVDISDLGRGELRKLISVLTLRE